MASTFTISGEGERLRCPGAVTQYCWGAEENVQWRYRLLTASVACLVYNRSRLIDPRALSCDCPIERSRSHARDLRGWPSHTHWGKQKTTLKENYRRTLTFGSWVKPRRCAYNIYRREGRNRIHETQHDRTNMDKHLTTNLYYGDTWLDQVWYLDTTVTSNVAGRLQSFVHVYPVRKGLTSMSVTSLKGFL